MLEIKAFMNSSVEAIFDFKTCCGMRAFDQNLELRLINQGERRIQVPSSCDLITEHGIQRLDHLMPHGTLTIEPGETAAFYCTMDEAAWGEVREIVFRDAEGREYRQEIYHGLEA